ncbi:hypothetical protein EIMP300_45620 [Escherichia coli]|uniref:Uncharacterized protein n=1 Tax=Escherichia coli TaxID=562 RepID=A0A8S0FS41_ECOLX|nr:hypothetical protein EIMP300_45620 [Escherichia coli]
MGTLGNQPCRSRYEFDDFNLANPHRAAALTKLAKETGVSVDTLIKLEIAMQLNRLNSILIENGDKMDENLAGIGEILQK